MKNNFDVIIIGGGAAGLMCAAYLCSKNKSLDVCLIERNSRVGKKILVTGNGRCNLENLDISVEDYYSDDNSKLKSILTDYDTDSVLSFFEQNLGMHTDSLDNLVYPITFKATTVLDCLRFYTENITTITEQVVSINKFDEKYQVLVKSGQFTANSLVLAVGGAAAPYTGSDGSLFPVIKKLAGKDSFTKILPALVPFKTSDSDIKALSGNRFKCTVTINNHTEQGEMLFTDYGVSGIVVMQLSRFYYESVEKGIKSVDVLIDLLPKYSLEEKKEIVSNLISSFPDRSSTLALTGLINRQLAEVVVKRSGNNPTSIANTLHNFKLTVTGTLGFDNAQVTRGGLKLTALNDNLELLNSSKCYACGELLNVDGPCGGYNLHWAWASAMKVADSIIKDSL
ncbi:MAG: aminoacetone oxidase family FAD-binding enzyme [Saccharofermentans sp.]|nr:aminoacetone oxidase family FAD-binding enzyme [Saccharofermentans sp.]